MLFIKVEMITEEDAKAVISWVSSNTGLEVYEYRLSKNDQGWVVVAVINGPVA